MCGCVSAGGLVPLRINCDGGTRPAGRLARRGHSGHGPSAGRASLPRGPAPLCSSRVPSARRGTSRLVGEPAAPTPEQHGAGRSPGRRGALHIRFLQSVWSLPRGGSTAWRLKGAWWGGVSNFGVCACVCAWVCVHGCVCMGMCVCESKDHQAGDGHAAGGHPWWAGNSALRACARVVHPFENQEVWREAH